MREQYQKISDQFIQHPDSLKKLRKIFLKTRIDDKEADWRQIQILLDTAGSNTSSYKKFRKFVDTGNLKEDMLPDRSLSKGIYINFYIPKNIK